ncbi:MAG: lysophospholipid acyltransferase family protein [Acidimicrobiales bacterium]
MTSTEDLREWSFAVGDAPMGFRVHGATCWVMNRTLLPYLRVTVRGRHRLDIPGPLLIAPVHRSNLDSLIVGSLSGRRMRAMAKESLFKVKPLAWYISAVGAFPLTRGTADREAMKAALLVLERGDPLLVFPEGTRQSGTEVAELFDGTMWLANKGAAPVVPIGIAGTEEAMPPGARFPRRSHVAVVVGEPLTPPEGRVSRRELSELTAELRARMQQANNQARRDSQEAA